MNIKQLILEKIKKNQSVKTAEIVKATGFSRNYVNRFFQELVKTGKIILVGRANQVRYILADKKIAEDYKKNILEIKLALENKNLSEDTILERIKKETGIFFNLLANISSIFSYAFLEILNNAIEHSQSKIIKLNVKRQEDTIYFEIKDEGVGIFANITKKKKLASHLEAIQDLLKGKQTTMPQSHTGEGIFFTSKLADVLIIQSAQKRLTFNNIIDDVIIENVKETKGTKVAFSVKIQSKKDIKEVFDKYTDSSFEFSKTEVVVRLYQMGEEFLSRSQARRIMTGLEKFRTIILDFKGVKTIGQAFADEVFRVWQSSHRHIKINFCNANENVEFMIKRTVLQEKIGG